MPRKKINPYITGLEQDIKFLDEMLVKAVQHVEEIQHKTDEPDTYKNLTKLKTQVKTARLVLDGLLRRCGERAYAKDLRVLNLLPKSQ